MNRKNLAFNIDESKSEKYLGNMSPAIRKVIESQNLQIEFESTLSELRKSEEHYRTQNKELIEVNKELLLSKEKAEENDRLKTAFLQNITHEILTPMTGILGFSELLKDQSLSVDKQQEYIQLIEQSGKRLLKIINELINISKIERGQIVLSIQSTNVNHVVRHLHEFFKPEAKKRNLKLNCQTELPDEFCMIETDSTKLTQVLSNLLYNALKFTLAGSINFGYNLKGNMLEFFVEDTGIGIEPEMHEIIFERFRRLDMSVSRNLEGSGLGLSISKAFVNKLGGRIWLKSEISKGTCFYFTIPYNLINFKTDPD